MAWRDGQTDRSEPAKPSLPLSGGTANKIRERSQEQKKEYQAELEANIQVGFQLMI